jgi:two-component system phosphate regulon response regulator PhoB
MTRRRILIVDDDDSVRSLLRMTLPEDEYEIDEATDGEQALARLDERVREVVVLEWNLPGRHGSLVLDELKRRHPKLPVIVLTAEIAEHHRSLAEALKVDVFLTKPFSPLELLETIERLLAEHPLDEAS